MSGLIKKLFHGWLDPVDEEEPTAPEYEKSQEQFLALRDAFAAGLASRQIPAYHELLLAQEKALSYKIEQAFTDGFRLGAKFEVAVFYGDVEDDDEQN